MGKKILKKYIKMHKKLFFQLFIPNSIEGVVFNNLLFSIYKGAKLSLYIALHITIISYPFFYPRKIGSSVTNYLLDVHFKYRK